MTSATLRLPPAPERVVQTHLFQWLTYQRYQGHKLSDFAFAIPNGTKLAGTQKQRAMQASALLAQGMRPGVPDFAIAIPVNPFHGLFIELKRDDKATVQSNQLEWQAKLRLMGYKSEIACGFDDAKAAVCKYFGITP